MGVGVGEGVGVGVGVGAMNLTLIVGTENVNPLALKYVHPFRGTTEVVAMFCWPS